MAGIIPLEPCVEFVEGEFDRARDVAATRDAIDSYIHTYYEDIEDRYRAEVFNFRI